MKILILMLAAITITQAHAGNGSGLKNAKALNSFAMNYENHTDFDTFKAENNQSASQTALVRFNDYTVSGNLVFDVKYGNDNIDRVQVNELDNITDTFLDALERSQDNNNNWQEI